MKRNCLLFLMLGVALASSANYLFATTNSIVTKIYLPRNATITTGQITVDDVTIITGTDSHSEKIGAIKLGKAPFPGQEINLSRTVIKSQLSAEGIDCRNVIFSGAEEIKITRQAEDFKTTAMIACAQNLMKNKITDSTISWKAINWPKKIVLNKTQSKATLRAEEKEYSPAGQIHIKVHAVLKDKVIATRTVWFKLSYKVRQVIAVRSIKRGEEITTENAKYVEVQSDRPRACVKSPFGKRAYRTIQKDGIITSTCLMKEKPAVLVKQNDTVKIKIVGDGWSISALGRALEKAVEGQVIRVRNIDSKKVIMCKIDAAGDAIPVKR